MTGKNNANMRKMDFFVSVIFALSAAAAALGIYDMYLAKSIKAHDANLAGLKDGHAQMLEKKTAIDRLRKDNPEAFELTARAEIEVGDIIDKLLSITKKSGYAGWVKYEQGHPRKADNFEETVVSLQYTAVTRNDVFGLLMQIDKDSSIPFKPKDMNIDFGEKLDIKKCQVDLASYKRITTE
ncbi:MAG: hypothetical protein HZA48_12770 [Planctomycetes bacterium]|nr:hypothetical protein [Planctomycetota bacterium]